MAGNLVIMGCGTNTLALETSMHTPLIVSVPGENQPNTQSGRITALTELIDIYPSVCELTGLTKPAHLQGTSFVPLLKNPTLAGKTHAVGRYRSGDTIRTDQFRLSEFRTANGSGNTIGSMLYDHRTDPDENQNIAESDQQQSTVEQLSEALRKTIPKVNRLGNDPHRQPFNSSKKLADRIRVHRHPKPTLGFQRTQAFRELRLSQNSGFHRTQAFKGCGIHPISIHRFRFCLSSRCNIDSRLNRFPAR